MIPGQSSEPSASNSSSEGSPSSTQDCNAMEVDNELLPEPERPFDAEVSCSRIWFYLLHSFQFQIERILMDACNVDVTHRPQLDADWDYGDDQDLIERFADAIGASEHVATMPMYQASMTLQFEHARCRMKLKETLATLRTQTTLVNTLTTLLEKKRRRMVSR